MEILAIIGIIVLILIIFTGGGLLGWLFHGLGAVFEFLLAGWGILPQGHFLDYIDSHSIIGIGIINKVET